MERFQAAMKRKFLNFSVSICDLLNVFDPFCNEIFRLYMKIIMTMRKNMRNKDAAFYQNHIEKATAKRNMIWLIFSLMNKTMKCKKLKMKKR